MRLMRPLMACCLANTTFAHRAVYRSGAQRHCQPRGTPPGAKCSSTHCARRLRPLHVDPAVTVIDQRALIEQAVPSGDIRLMIKVLLSAERLADMALIR